MLETLLIARSSGHEWGILPAMANRHGLITGATGTGKTVTLQVMAEHFSARGVPVFLADIKGDLSGMAQPGKMTPALQARLMQVQGPAPTFAGSPVVLWDALGQAGHPLRATVSAIGPVLLARMLGLNDTQEGVLNIAFRLADEAGWLLLDLKDLRAIVQHVGEQARALTTQYGNVSAASVGAIMRALLVLEQQGGAAFLGEPMLDWQDLLRTDAQGRGVVNMLVADALVRAPRLYAAVLLWLLSELFERLPEVGDVPQPKLVFFFDEAHMLFADAPPALLERIEQVVRLVRSKGVGVYFVTQNPLDVPDRVLGQLGNRVQHALRAFTPRDQKAVRAAAQTLCANPALDAERVLGELGVGEALVSFLDERGRPTPVERALIVPPAGRLGPLTPQERQALLLASPLADKYNRVVDRESAYEQLRDRVAEREPAAPGARTQRSRTEDMVAALVTSAARSLASAAGRELVRGVLGTLLGGPRRRG